MVNIVVVKKQPQAMQYDRDIDELSNSLIQDPIKTKVGIHIPFDEHTKVIKNTVVNNVHVVPVKQSIYTLRQYIYLLQKLEGGTW